MSRAPAARVVGIALLALAVAGCERIGEAVDGIRRSSQRNWEQGRRRIGGAAPLDAALIPTPDSRR
jgi:hypothetical protein